MMMLVLLHTAESPTALRRESTMAALRAAGINDRLMSAANLVCPLPCCAISHQSSQDAICQIAEDPSFTDPSGSSLWMSVTTNPICLQDPEMQAALGSGDSTREAQLLETWKAYKKGFQQGIALFNSKPKKGIAYLQVCFNYQRTPETPFPPMAPPDSHDGGQAGLRHPCTGTQDAHGSART